ncbi:MAG: metalloregulator ArsR/SmtB family transcription factor [Candidatus Omnitrophica bacterium]|nr:metalloregulator ArsR/SmtB family transcription factor [Candidatus Omnitrophota bacterium]
MVDIFKALADKTRQDIIEILGEEEMNVTDICNMFNISQPTISHHLHILKNSDLVATRKEGKKVYYYVKKEVVNGVFGRVLRKMRITIIKDE